MSMQVAPQDFPEIRWKGHWIWVPEEKVEIKMAMPGEETASKKEAHGLFRKTFHLDQLPERVPARITANSRYVLYVNEQEVFRGPVRSQPRRLYYDLFDLAPYLRVGENVIAVHVKYYGSPKSFWMPAAPNVTLGKTGVMVFEADLGEAGWLVSDPTWKAHKSEAWSSDGAGSFDLVGGGVPVDVLDGRKLPANWMSAGFDDSLWGSAQKIPAVHIGGFAHTQPPTDPYGPLYPRPISKLGGEIVRPARVEVRLVQGEVDSAVLSPVVRVSQAADLPVVGAIQKVELPLTLEIQEGCMASLFLDMGRVVSGLVQLDITTPAGTTFEMNYVEDPIKAEVSFLSAHAGSRYTARGEHDSFEVFDSNGFRYAYLLIHGASGPVTLNGFAVRENIYPWQPGASFQCSDEDLNRIYEAGIRTVQLNSHDAFIDCPTREQRAWVGDSVVHQMVHLATNLDWRLAWHYLTLGNSPRYDGILPMSVAGEVEASGSYTIPDWSLHWVHGVYNLYRFTGDREAVKNFMPAIERVLRWYAPYQISTGVLKDVTEWNLVDWSSVCVEDTSSILTSVWARGLREFAEMAAWLGENASRGWADGLYEKARAGFEIFWDEVRGSYIDHIKDGVKQQPMSQLAGALAVCSGLAPQERWARIVQTITDPNTLVVKSWTGAETGEYSMEKIGKQMMGIYEIDWDAEKQVVIAQPFMSYTVHDAVALAGMADRLPELYRSWLQFLVNGFDTIGECWGWGTHVHGWSCTPTRDMVFYTLGVTPAEPGYTKARIAPHLGKLAWAKGSVPTPHGLISVSVNANQVTVKSPVPFILDLPGKAAQILPAGEHAI